MHAVIVGAGGQVGSALAAEMPTATALGHDVIDIADADRADVDWSAYDTVFNAAAYTDVDGAETGDGRQAAWRANAAGPAALAAIARRHELTLVHLSSEYVFDGQNSRPYTEEDPAAPLSAYGSSKAAGDVAARAAERHYVLRPTWVVGNGRNFVRAMLALGRRDISPTVVADQVGRLTFAGDIARAGVHLVTTGAPYGTYHVTGSGLPASWAEVARATLALAGHRNLAVRETTTAAYFADRPEAARRPLNSVLDVRKAQEAGVVMPDWRECLAAYVSAEASTVGA